MIPEIIKLLAQTAISMHKSLLAGVVVVDYIDNASGIMVESPDGGGHIMEVTLNPIVTVNEVSLVENANNPHKKDATINRVISSMKQKTLL